VLYESNFVKMIIPKIKENKMSKTEELLTDIRNMAIVNFAEIQMLKKALCEKLDIELPERHPEYIHPDSRENRASLGYMHYDSYEFANEIEDIVKNLHGKCRTLDKELPHLTS